MSRTPAGRQTVVDFHPMECQERERLVQVYYTARAVLSKLTADYDARSKAGTDEASLKALLSARVTYDDAAAALELHEREHQCTA